MRSRLPRLAGIATAAALVLSPLAAASPATALDPGQGTISVTLVDDLGQPVRGSVQLIPSEAGSQPIALGLPVGGGVPAAAASFTENIDAGTYGAMVVGGWAGITCVGLATCDVTSMMGGAPPAGGAGVFTVNEGAPTSLTITIATPKLTGAPGVGQPLTVSAPSSLSALGATMGAMLGAAGGLGAGMSGDPVVTWNRNGAPLGATGTTYTPTTADAGSTISATVTYPAVLSLYFTMLAPGVVPAPFTTSAVSIGKLTPTVELSVPGKVKQGTRPTAFVNVKSGTSPLTGAVSLKIKGKRTEQAFLRAGLAKFTLPKLKPGKYQITAVFDAVGAYEAASTSKTVIVKAKKAKKKKHKKR